jgi:hypothetical protein
MDGIMKGVEIVIRKAKLSERNTNEECKRLCRPKAQARGVGDVLQIWLRGRGMDAG